MIKLNIWIRWFLWKLEYVMDGGESKSGSLVLVVGKVFLVDWIISSIWKGRCLF